MFRFVGVGEQAGSGIPKIYSGWKDQHWRAPALYECNTSYNQTLLELRMLDLLPEEVLAGLRLQFGPNFDQLSHITKSPYAGGGRLRAHGQPCADHGDDRPALSGSLASAPGAGAYWVSGKP